MVVGSVIGLLTSSGLVTLAAEGAASFSSSNASTGVGTAAGAVALVAAGRWRDSGGSVPVMPPVLTTFGTSWPK